MPIAHVTLQDHPLVVTGARQSELMELRGCTMGTPAATADGVEGNYALGSLLTPSDVAIRTSRE